MANTTLTAYVGLTPADAELMFDKLADVQPHWKGRWGLKATPVEAIAFFFSRLWWYNAFLLKPNSSLPQAIMRCRDTDRKGEHVKELGAHKIEFTTKGIAHYVVAMQSKKSFVV